MNKNCDEEQFTYDKLKPLTRKKSRSGAIFNALCKILKAKGEGRGTEKEHSINCVLLPVMNDM